MKDFPPKITKENFQEVADSIISASASVEKNKKIKKIVKPISGILFVFFSLIFSYGTLYANRTVEKSEFFEYLSPLTKIWNSFESISNSFSMNEYIVYWVLIAAAFIIPLIASAIIKFIVSCTYKSKQEHFSEDDIVSNAKKLHSLATALYNNSSDNKNKSERTPYKVIFILLFSALYIVFFENTLLEFAVTICVVYWLYDFLLMIFFALNKLFYKNKIVSNVTQITDEYWVSVDENEAERRKAEAERIAKEQQEKCKQEEIEREEKRRQEEIEREKRRQEEAALETSIDEYDSFTWTERYVRNNERKCSDITLSVQKVAKELLSEGDNSGAAAGFDKVVHALELFKEIDEEFYLPLLFVNCYVLSEIFAIGLGNKASACKYAKKACEYAKKCNTPKSLKDLEVMRPWYEELSSSRPLSDIIDEFDFDYPDDIIYKK